MRGLECNETPSRIGSREIPRRSGDFHVLLLATLHRALFWFSPFSWRLLNELAETAELVSDDAAIEVLGDRPSYAEILLDVARSGRPVSAGLATARTRSVLARVERILT
jgi:beta-lactamase regulating signal transducer with metallopeptidase domain